MKQGYIIDENATRIMLDLPDNAEDLTGSYVASKTAELQQRQYEEQCKQNKRQFWISVITTAVSILALIVSILALFATQ